MNNYRQIKKQQLFNGMLFYSSLVEMEEELNTVDYVIMKGEPLSMQAYGCFGNRQSHDIDILIDREHVQVINRILNAHGFYQLNRDLSRIERIYSNQAHQIFSYIKHISGNVIVIDINVDIFWGEYEGKRVNISEFIKDSIEMYIYGFKAKVLRPLKALVALTLHHYKELNSLHQLARKDHPYKAKLFKDFYYLLRNNSITVQSYYNICSFYEIVPYAYFILYYTNRFIGNDVLGDYVKLFETTEGVNLLECYGLTNRERKKWKITFEERLQSKDLFSVIKDDLSQQDLHKIKLQKRIFNNSQERIEVINSEYRNN